MATEAPRRREREDRSNGQERDKKPSFQVEVTLHLDLDLANALGNFILDANCPNRALLALAHQLVGS